MRGDEHVLWAGNLDSMNTSTQAAGSNGVERRPALHGAAEFVSWTWEMINGGVECGWSPDGTEIVVSNPEKLQADVIPVYFRHGQVPVGPSPSTNPNPNPTLTLTLTQRARVLIQLRLPASPYISLHLATSPYLACCRPRRTTRSVSPSSTGPTR